MSDTNLDLELDTAEVEEYLQEEFNPELFYKALTNALAQLRQYDAEASVAA